MVVPKPLRDQLGLDTDTPLEIEVVDNHLEISAHRVEPQIVEGPHGPVVARTGAPLTDEDVRATLESAREHR